MPERSDPTNNAEIVRNAPTPSGFGRHRVACFVAAPLRYPRIAVVASPCIQPDGAPNDATATSAPGH
jgi:hypothetical protein